MDIKVSSDQSIDQVIINAIRDIGISITTWAKAHGLGDKSVVYQAAKGKGSRGVRIQIAMVRKQLPSEMWPNRSYSINRDDDHLYELMIGVRKLQQ